MFRVNSLEALESPYISDQDRSDIHVFMKYYCCDHRDYGWVMYSNAPACVGVTAVRALGPIIEAYLPSRDIFENNPRLTTSTATRMYAAALCTYIKGEIRRSPRRRNSVQ